MADNFMGPGLTLDDVYPVGSIYMSANAADPANLFGGTWQRIQERFLLAAGSTHAAGSTGGEFEHRLTVDEMPSHAHNTAKGEKSDSAPIKMDQYQTYQSQTGITPGNYWFATTLSAGGGKSHNITPPYLAVYMWQRTA